MKISTYLMAAVLFAACAIQTGTVRAQDDELPTAEAVIQKYVEATGGMDAYQAMTSMKVTGTLTIEAQGMTGKIEQWSTAPNKTLMVLTLEGVGEEKQGYDGETAWATSMMTGNRILEGAELEEMALQADFRRMYSPFELYKSMTCTGVEDVNGKKCYVIEIEKNSGGKSTEYYEAESGLAVKSVSTSMTQMGEVTITGITSEYKEVNGLKIPHKIEQDFGPVQMEIEFATIEINGDIPDSTYALPETIEKLAAKERERREETEPAADGGNEEAAEPAEAAAGGGGN